jgi:hypothetical protein
MFYVAERLSAWPVNRTCRIQHYWNTTFSMQVQLVWTIICEGSWCWWESGNFLSVTNLMHKISLLCNVT